MNPTDPSTSHYNSPAGSTTSTHTFPFPATRGQKRAKVPQTQEEKRVKEREKKARWRAKKREKDSLSHHFEIPYTVMSQEAWKTIKDHLKIHSNGSPEDESRALLKVLHSIGYEWTNSTITRAPALTEYPKLVEMRKEKEKKDQSALQPAPTVHPQTSFLDTSSAPYPSSLSR